jgi:hypothetical protein
MIKISKSYQIIFYAIVLIFSVLFFFYFYKQASITSVTDVSQVNVTSNQTKNSVLGAGVKLNLDFFNSDKFRSLRSNAAPAANFQSGKRNPFQPD